MNRQLAGNGELTVELTDPSDEPVKLDMHRTADGDDVVEFIPAKVGQYKLTTKLAGFLVNGMSFLFSGWEAENRAQDILVLKKSDLDPSSHLLQKGSVNPLLDFPIFYLVQDPNSL